MAQAQEEAQRQHIIEVLRKANGRIRGKRGAAELLNTKPATPESRIARLSILTGTLFD